MTSTTKRCVRCREVKLASEFYRKSHTVDGLRSRCKTCMYVDSKRWKSNNPEKVKEHQRRGHYRRDFGVDASVYDRMLEMQDGCCAICGATDPGTRWGTFPLDHDHETGQVRGLLCQPCNIGLGVFRDDPELLRAAIAYLGEKTAEEIRARRAAT